MDTKYRKYKDAAGFTDGKNMYYNLFSSSFQEEWIEYDLSFIFTHELLHTMNMKLSEKKITLMCKELYQNMRKNGIY